MIKSKLFAATALGFLAYASLPIVYKATAQSPLSIAKEAIAELNAPPRIEVVFVLDTTGSMSGLIDGAKKKIWAIASDILNTEKQAEIEMALIGYRDRGDDYVTKITDLSNDMDALYGDLLGYQAQGGGDRPESVNQALWEAVNDLDWSDDDKTLKMVFLVGDAPPKHYEQDNYYQDTAKLAREKDIFVNTVLAGSATDTGDIWKEIASIGGGRFMQIPQDGGTRIVETPYDQDIIALEKRINATVIPYGAAPEREAAAAKHSRKLAAVADDRASETVSSMAGYRSKSGKINAVITGGGDLTEDFEDGKITVEELDKDHLPEDYKVLENTELQEKLTANVEERSRLNKTIARLVEKRDAYVKRKMEEEGDVDSFDREVSVTIRAQAKTKGIAYKD